MLERVISLDKTGFIAYRYVSDNTQLLYDTLNYYEVGHKRELLLVMDLAKALDTREWSYIYECRINMNKLLHEGSLS